MQRLATRLLCHAVRPPFASLAFARVSLAAVQMRTFTNINAAVPAHEGEIRNFGDDYEAFMVKQRGQHELPLNALTQFMDSSLLTRTMSYGEHLDYQPFIEELANGVVRWSKSHPASDASLEQGQTLLQFGMQYDIRTKHFWTAVLDIIEASLDASMQHFADVMEIVSLLKDQGLLNNRIMRAVSSYVDDVATMSPLELSFFVQVFTSDEMQQATVIRGGLAKIEDALLKQVDNFSVEEFSRIANSVRHIVSE